jgi:hypothetical protein
VQPDGVPVPWTNPESGNQGSVAAQETSEEGGTTCRTLRFEHTAGGQPESGKARFCRDGEGAWTSKTPGLAASGPEGRGTSVMFGDADPLPEGLARFPADARAERCSSLSRSIQELEGKPQQRYAAIQEYEAECVRAYQPE